MTLERLAKAFISTYLRFIRHYASMISKQDRPLFPTYWFLPYQIIIFKNIHEDLAIVLRRDVSGKKDKISIRSFNGRIEESVLPNLNYNKWPMFRIEKDHHHISFRGGTMNVTDHPLFTIAEGSEAKWLEIRVEASVSGYPREYEFLWMLTFPNRKYLVEFRAEEEANSDFWQRFVHIINLDIGTLFTRDFGKKTLELFIKTLEIVKENFTKLISREDLVEQQLQEFLEKHYFLFSPDETIVNKSRVVGPFRTDFTLQKKDGSLILVELQLNRDPLIINGKISHGLKEATQQVCDWFKWLEENEKKDFQKYKGVIVVGRKHDYESNAALVDDLISKLPYPVKFRTYDDLLESIEYIIQELLERARDLS